jgi:hypothetical protein
MIVHDFHVKQLRGTFRPSKTNPPLLVDAYAVLALAIPLEPFQPITRRVERHQAVRGVQAVEPQHGLPLESLKRLNPNAFEKGASPLVAETYNH